MDKKKKISIWYIVKYVFFIWDAAVCSCATASGIHKLLPIGSGGKDDAIRAAETVGI